MGNLIRRIGGDFGFHPEKHVTWVFSAEQLREIAQLLDEINNEARREAE